MVKVGVVVVLVELENLKEVVQEEMDVLDHQVAVSQNVDQVDVCHKEEIQVDMLVGSSGGSSSFSFGGSSSGTSGGPGMFTNMFFSIPEIMNRIIYCNAI